MQVIGGTPDVTTYFALRLAADGTAATGLTVTDFDLQYVRSGAAPVAKEDAIALENADDPHADNKAFEIDATDQPGLYRVDWPDAAFAAAVREVILTVKCATCFTEHLAVQIDTPVDVQKVDGDATAAANLNSACDNYSVTRGLAGTALPAAVAAAAGGIPLSTAGSLEMDTLADWVDAGRLDAILDAIAADTNELQADDIPTAVAAVQTTVDAIEVDTGELGGAVGASISADIAAVKAETALIVEDTNELQGDDIPTAVAAVQTTVDAIETDTQDLQTQVGAAGAGLTDLGGMSAGMQTEVNDEVVDVLKTDTVAEQGQGAPTATPTMQEMLSYLYMAWRNKKTQTSSLQTMFADDGSTAVTKATVSDNGTTATKDEVISGV